VIGCHLHKSCELHPIMIVQYGIGGGGEECCVHTGRSSPKLPALNLTNFSIQHLRWVSINIKITHFSHTVMFS